ncbi:hypothetical protein WJX73_001706 [Symbiochloris irregularis]|uniref:SprT-like domain-containing protein n=1 Tax=Symbiochloris irregularis TaxID=706552 RepID=A0AAW1PNF4_9CHLO
MDNRNAAAVAAPVRQPSASVSELQRASSEASSGLAALSSSPSSAGVQTRGAAGSVQLSVEVDSHNSTACLQRGLSVASGTSDALSEGQMLLFRQRLKADMDSGGEAASSDEDDWQVPRTMPLSQAQLSCRRIVTDSSSDEGNDHSPTASCGSSNSLPIRHTQASVVGGDQSPKAVDLPPLSPSLSPSGSFADALSGQGSPSRSNSLRQSLSAQRSPVSDYHSVASQRSSPVVPSSSRRMPLDILSDGSPSRAGEARLDESAGALRHAMSGNRPGARRRITFADQNLATEAGPSWLPTLAASQEARQQQQHLQPVHDDSSSDEDLGTCMIGASTVKRQPSRWRIDSSDSEGDQASKAGKTPSQLQQGGEGAVEALTAAQFKRQRSALAQQLFSLYNAQVFQGRLPQDLDISWNSKLTTTAGLTQYQRSAHTGKDELQYTAQVQLSSKVVDCYEKLQRTLLHELCHVAAWLLDHVAKPPHGAAFKVWAIKAMRAFPGLEVTTCHTYAIHMPHQWQCSNGRCGQMYRRFTKSLDTSKRCCGVCRHPLTYLGKFSADGTESRARNGNSFSAFVKQNFAAVKAAQGPATPHREVMRELSNRWREREGAAD